MAGVEIVTSLPLHIRTDTRQVANTIEKKKKLIPFLEENVSDFVPSPAGSSGRESTRTRSDFVADVEAGMKAASMAVRLTPYVLSIIDWTNPINDPIRRQFIPLKSTMIDDHSLATLDSLHENEDSPVKNLVHRYPDKVLFLGRSIHAHTHHDSAKSA